MVAVRVLTVILALGGAAVAAESIPVPGSSTTYPATLDVVISGKNARLNLTGVAMRRKVIVNVYTVGSYLEAGHSVKTAEELARVDCIKRLHLIMERTVSGKEMAQALQEAIRKNYPSPAFDAEVTRLVELFKNLEVNKGDQILLTHIPGVGLHCQVCGKCETMLGNGQFYRAIWDVYLGKNNLGEAIKKGLTSRL